MACYEIFYLVDFLPTPILLLSVDLAKTLSEHICH